MLHSECFHECQRQGQLMLSCSAMAVKEDAVQTECKLKSDKHNAQRATILQSDCLSHSHWNVTHLHICAAAPCNLQPASAQLLILQRNLETSEITLSSVSYCKPVLQQRPAVRHRGFRLECTQIHTIRLTPTPQYPGYSASGIPCLRSCR